MKATSGPPTDPLLIEVPARLLTERLILRVALPGDGPAINAAVVASLADLQPWMPWAQVSPPVEASELVARRMAASFAAREDLAWLVFGRDEAGQEGLLIGGCGLHRIDWALPRFEIGYWLRSGFGGLGLATETVRALTRLAFDVLHARRVEIRMDRRNRHSSGVAERAGFTLEGLLRQDVLDVHGVPRDTCVYARVRGVEEPNMAPEPGTLPDPTSGGAG